MAQELFWCTVCQAEPTCFCAQAQLQGHTAAKVCLPCAHSGQAWRSIGVISSAPPDTQLVEPCHMQHKQPVKGHSSQLAEAEDKGHGPTGRAAAFSASCLHSLYKSPPTDMHTRA